MNTDRPKYFLQTTPSTITKARALRKRMTTQEKILWAHLKNNSLGVRFRRQVPFGPFILDFLCVTKRLAIELDGNHHFEPTAVEYDKARDEYLQSNSINVIRFRNIEIHKNLEGVLSIIWKEIKKG